jgi:hypothetical protein
MATGFGFSTDFIAGISLVQELINALNDSRGSSKEYLELIAELRTLETALLEVKTLDLAVEQRPQRAALRQAATQCQNSIDSFPERLGQVSSISATGRIGLRVEGHFKKDTMEILQERRFGAVQSRD